MKKFFKILTMLTTATLLIGATACSNDDTEYSPAPLPDGENLYFGQELNKTVVEVQKDANEHTVYVRRAKAGDEYTVELITTESATIDMSIPQRVTFAAGALEAPVKITYNFSKMQPDSKYAVALTLADEQTTQFGETSVEFSLAYIPMIEWEEKSLSGTMSEDFFSGKHAVKILKQKGKNYYRIEKVMYQIWQEDPDADDFAECENISFSLTDDYEPIKPETFTCDFGYDHSQGRVGFFFGNEGYNPELFTFTRSGYLYTLKGFFSLNGEPWNLMTFKLNITSNPFDEKWDERFVTNYNNKEYEDISGLGEFTSKVFPEDDGSPSKWEQGIASAEEEGVTIYYLPNLYANGFGLAVLSTPGEEEGDEPVISIPENQPLGIQMFGSDVYMSRGRVAPLELEFDDDGILTHAVLPLKIHLKNGTSLGEFAEEFNFEFIPAGDVTEFLGTYTVNGLNGANAPYAPFNVTISKFDTDVSEIVGSKNAVKISGLLPAELMQAVAETEQGFYTAIFNPLKNHLIMSLDLLFKNETFEEVFEWNFPTKSGTVKGLPTIQLGDLGGSGQTVTEAYLVRDENTGVLSFAPGADTYILTMFKPDMSGVIGMFDWVFDPEFTPATPNGFRASSFLPAVKTAPREIKHLRGTSKLVRKSTQKRIDTKHLKVTPEVNQTRILKSDLQKRAL